MTLIDLLFICTNLSVIRNKLQYVASIYTKSKRIRLLEALAEVESKVPSRQVPGKAWGKPRYALNMIKGFWGEI